MNKITFEDLPSTNTPINANNLNAIQANAESAITTLQTDVGLGNANIPVIQNQNINNITKSGIVYTDTCNYGGTSLVNGYLLTTRLNDNYILQTHFGYTSESGGMSYRKKINGSWTGWTTNEERKTCTPSLLGCSITYTTRTCSYVRQGKMIHGVAVIRGDITSVDSSNPYARIKLNLPQDQAGSWYSFGVIQEAYGCTNDAPYCIDCVEIDTLSLQSQSTRGTGALSWKVANGIYLKIGFTIQMY